ncbi:hypothetical protein M3212_20095, partial [Alkalihalobacillus oceani]|uniref:hypothetical protein n=1 Tax=Halalkalibacter oceani TaxID=1653776 RepID=UPI00203D9451
MKLSTKLALLMFLSTVLVIIAVNDVLQCLDLDGANCPKTDGFTVQNEGEAILCSPFILQIYL